MTLGERLREVRKAKKMTQDAVAKKLEVDFTTVSKWENDNATPDLKVLLRLSEVYEVDIRYLIGANIDEPDGEDGIDPHLRDVLKQMPPDQQRELIDFIKGSKTRERVVSAMTDGSITPEDLKKRFKLKVGDREATDEEIDDAIAFIRAKRIMKMIE